MARAVAAREGGDFPTVSFLRNHYHHLAAKPRSIRRYSSWDCSEFYDPGGVGVDCTATAGGGAGAADPRPNCHVHEAVACVPAGCKELQSVPPGGTWRERFWVKASGY